MEESRTLLVGTCLYDGDEEERYRRSICSRGAMVGEDDLPTPREALFDVRSIKILIGPATTAMSSNLSRPVIGTASLSENRRDSRAHRFDLVLFLLRAI